MATDPPALDLGHTVVLLAAAVIAVPLFRKLGLGAVLGYLCAGLLIGPYGLELFDDPEAILHVAELGVVLFLFLIGLEMRPSKLWALRREIFGLGVAQVLTCGALLSGVGLAFGWPPAVAVLGAMGFVLSSTAVIMKMLDERGETATAAGQRAVSVLLLEDLLARSGLSVGRAVFLASAPRLRVDSDRDRRGRWKQKEEGGARSWPRSSSSIILLLPSSGSALAFSARPGHVKKWPSGRQPRFSRSNHMVSKELQRRQLAANCGKVAGRWPPGRPGWPDAPPHPLKPCARRDSSERRSRRMAWQARRSARRSGRRLSPRCVERFGASGIPSGCSKQRPRPPDPIRLALPRADLRLAAHAFASDDVR